MNNIPIYLGDRFEIHEHMNGCCNHIVLCEIRINEKCRCGYGLHNVKTGKLISNAEIASGYSKEEK